MFSRSKYLHRTSISSFDLVLVTTTTYCGFYVYYQAGYSYYPHFIDEKNQGAFLSFSGQKGKIHSLGLNGAISSVLSPTVKKGFF